MSLKGAVKCVSCVASVTLAIFALLQLFFLHLLDGHLCGWIFVVFPSLRIYLLILKSFLFIVTVILCYKYIALVAFNKSISFII
jgi:hypothetical protein